jgi:hypothetical protein
MPISFPRITLQLSSPTSSLRTRQLKVLVKNCRIRVKSNAFIQSSTIALASISYVKKGFDLYIMP